MHKTSLMDFKENYPIPPQGRNKPTSLKDGKSKQKLERFDDILRLR
jgi:hypothetical protein